MGTLMLVASFVMMLPQPFVALVQQEEALFVSRIASIVVMIMYLCLLLFELYTHRDIMDGHGSEPLAVASPCYHRAVSAPLINPEKGEVGIMRHDNKSLSPFVERNESMNLGKDFPKDPEAQCSYEDDDEEEDLELSLPVAVLMLLISTLLLSFLSDYLVDAIMPMAEQLKISPAFIAIGSATQVSIFAISSSVLVAWVMDLGLTLAFDSFEQHIIIFAMINDGKTNWFRGVVLLLLYTLIGVGVFH